MSKQKDPETLEELREWVINEATAYGKLSKEEREATADFVVQAVGKPENIPIMLRGYRDAQKRSEQ